MTFGFALATSGHPHLWHWAKCGCHLQSEVWFYKHCKYSLIKCTFTDIYIENTLFVELWPLQVLTK